MKPNMKINSRNYKIQFLKVPKKNEQKQWQIEQANKKEDNVRSSNWCEFLKLYSQKHEDDKVWSFKVLRQ